MAEALRTTYWVPQMGSKFARSACGTKRKARAAARCEIAGVAKRPAAERAPAAAVDFRNALRSMTGPPGRVALSAGGQVPCRNARGLLKNEPSGPISRRRGGIDPAAYFETVRKVALSRKM